MLAQRIDQEAAWLAVGTWNTKAEDLKRFLEQKGIPLPQAEVLIQELRKANGQPTNSLPPPELVTEIKKQIIANMFRKDK
jgi:hypothetical protein